MAVADWFTVARAAAAPFVVLLFEWDFHNHDYWATALFAVAMATDWFDGKLARRSGRPSALGSLLDPVADKLLVLSVLIVLVDRGIFVGWIVAAIVARELLVSGLRLAALERGTVLQARDLGKLKTWAQALAALLGGLAAAGPGRRGRGVVGAARRPRADLGIRARLRAFGAVAAARTGAGGGRRGRSRIDVLEQSGEPPDALVGRSGRVRAAAEAAESGL